MRCAIYTRKSTDEGLDREFNTLDAQREAAEAYIASQRHEGWISLPERFDDGGFSGGDTDRPALQRLLALVEEGAVDTVVVYKLDRLSRSLLDFLRIHELLESHGVGLVSVTQTINTSTSYGRMMVNVLLSFAQFEREQIAERTRDKIQAARRRGRWTGGWLPLGYDVAPEGGALIVNAEEAPRVRAIFQLYSERRSLREVVEELSSRCWRTKSWRTRKGTWHEGKAWTKSNLQKFLRDPVYAGKQKLGAETFKGLHPAIVPERLFDEVQAILDDNGEASGNKRKNRTGALLRGLVRCACCDAPMQHDWTRRRSREYRYYRCSNSKMRGASVCTNRAVPAAELESFVVDKIRAIGRDPSLQRSVIRESALQLKDQRQGLQQELATFSSELPRVRAACSRLAASAAEAPEGVRASLYDQLSDKQLQLETLDRRKQKIESELRHIADTELDEHRITSALEHFDGIWEALWVSERERVIRLLVENVVVDRANDQVTLNYRPHGFPLLAGEMRPTEEAG